MRVIIVIFLFVLSITTDLSAHNYLPKPEKGNVTRIPDISVSRAAYRELESGDSVDEYVFTAQKDQEIFVQLAVPVLDSTEGFRPVFALVAENGVWDKSRIEVKNGRLVAGAGLPPEAADTAPARSILVLKFQGEPELFNEVFTGTRYRQLQEMTVPAPADGVYHLFVYHPDGETGKYVLATGRKEQFSFADVVSLPSVRIRVRKFMGEAVWGDYLFWSALGAGVLAGLTHGLVRALGH